MNRKMILLLCAVLLVGSSIAYYVARRSDPTAPLAQPFTTRKPEYKIIRHIVYASGVLKLKNSTRVGSLVSGLVEDILVEENDTVTKNQLLTTINNGKRDAAVRAAKGALMQAQATFDYTKMLYERENVLYQKGLRADQEIQNTYQNYKQSEGALITAQANYDLAVIEYDNTQIRAPDDGIIIGIGVKKGLRITTDLDATVLFEIAQDKIHMEAELNLDESAAGHVKAGQKVTFNVENHPHKIFKGVLRSVAYAPIKTSGGLIYKAMLDIDNTEELLRPGMSIHAEIKVAKKEKALSIENVALYLDSKTIHASAQALGYEVRAISSSEKKKLEAEHRTVKYIWTLQDKVFCERAIETGLYDEQIIETTSGLAADEEYLFDVPQPHAMQDHYKKLFKGAL